MLKSFFLSPMHIHLPIALPQFYVPTRPFTLLLWPLVALGTLLFTLFFWWVVHRRPTT